MNVSDEKTLLEAVVCYALDGRRVLLAIKTRKIAEGLWLGYGGGPEPGETLDACVLRETGEEGGGFRVLPEGLERRAIIYCHNTKSDGVTFVTRLHVYVATRWEGEPSETAEMASPTWFSIDALPQSEMIPTDPDWLYQVLELTRPHFPHTPPGPSYGRWFARKVRLPHKSIDHLEYVPKRAQLPQVTLALLCLGERLSNTFEEPRRE